MGIDYSKKPSAPTAPPASSGPVNLTKRGQTVNLTKGGSGRPVRVNLNWNQRAGAPAGGGGGGFLKRLTGGAGGGGIDLDLGCLFELADGSKGVVQALGNAFGSLDRPPYVQLDKDDRSGTATDGENLLVSGEHSAKIRRLAVFAFIYQGVAQWSQADGRVTIHPPEGEPVTIALDETRDGVGMCAICVVQGSANGFTVERQVQYVRDHRELDEMFGFGLRWRAGTK